MTAIANDTMSLSESELVTSNETTYGGLQEHGIIVYTATGQKAKPKVRMSTETTDTGNSSKTTEACRGGNRATQVENSSRAWRNTNRTSETTRDHSWAPTSRESTVSQTESKAEGTQTHRAELSTTQKNEDQKRNACMNCTKKKHWLPLGSPHNCVLGHYNSIVHPLFPHDELL
jgi:hypothetical protein